MQRLEVWFNNGLFRAFPHVTEMTFKEEAKMALIIFGGDHKSVINLDNVNFYELMNE